MAGLVHGVGGTESGVRRLILDQARAWAADTSIEFGLFVRCEAGTEDAWRSEPNVVSVRSSRLGMPGRLVARELLSLDVARWRPDVIYLRHTTISPSLILLAASIPTVVGGDLDDLDELRVRSPLRFSYMRTTRELLLRRARRLMVVTHEIGRSRSITQLGIPIDVFPNTIDVTRYPELPAPANEQPRLVFIAAPGLPWAGVDKLMRLASAFPAWQFDVIGPSATDLPAQPPNVRAHGQLTQDEYLPIMATADVAIGPLALHRKGLSEASALKVAEYLACGIPVILGCREAAFPAGAPFLLQLENSEDNVVRSLDEIRAFVESWRGRRVGRDEVRPIDTSVVEPRRLTLIRALAGRKHASAA
jgi:glycosyltransferase involved in cell wall biosynthesis